jgi:hypothetical protein
MTDALDLPAIYRRAADWLETHEWCQGQYGVPEHRVSEAYAPVACCLVGACFFVSGHDRLVDLEVEITRNLFKAEEGVRPSDWNDAPGRTKAEVIAKLRQAADAADRAQ